MIRFALVIAMVLIAGAVRAQANGFQILEVLRERGAISEDDARVIRVAAALNPRILTGAASKAVLTKDAVDFSAAVTAAELELVRQDLLKRASLEAVASGVVSVTPKQVALVSSDLQARELATLSNVRLPRDLLLKAYEALKNNILVVHPLCPDGSKPSDGSCIPGKTWSAELFRSVVTVFKDGFRICTGSYVGTGVVLTAGHCVLEHAGTKSATVAAARLEIRTSQGKKLAVLSTPSVPAQMFGTCLPTCWDADYDFAVLQVTADASLLPMAVISALEAPGKVEITIAGYGESGTPHEGLNIGPQWLMLTNAEDPFEWTYKVGAGASSTCFKDSGGPIYLGAPRVSGDALSQIGVISGFLNGNDCFSARARAVNFGKDGPKQVLCTMLGTGVSFCG